MMRISYRKRNGRKIFWLAFASGIDEDDATRFGWGLYRFGTHVITTRVIDAEPFDENVESESAAHRHVLGCALSHLMSHSMDDGAIPEQTDVVAITEDVEFPAEFESNNAIVLWPHIARSFRKVVVVGASGAEMAGIMHDGGPDDHPLKTVLSRGTKMVNRNSHGE